MGSSQRGGAPPTALYGHKRVQPAAAAAATSRSTSSSNQQQHQQQQHQQPAAAAPAAAVAAAPAGAPVPLQCHATAMDKSGCNQQQYQKHLCHYLCVAYVYFCSLHDPALLQQIMILHWQRYIRPSCQSDQNTNIPWHPTPKPPPNTVDQRGTVNLIFSSNPIQCAGDRGCI